MNAPVFSPEALMQATFTEANDTKLIPVPVGEYIAVIKDTKIRPWESKKDPSKAGLALDVTWEIDDQAVRDLLGREAVTIRQGIMLDVTDSGGLDMGKGRNVGLGRLREALDLNTPGAPFGFSQLPGRVGKIVVKHRVDGQNVYSEVDGVTKM